jgi:hypothetical protein
MEVVTRHVSKQQKNTGMIVGFRLSDHVVEDGFSFEGVGHDEHTFRQYFKDLPHNLLHELLKHFNNRREWEVCGIIRDLLRHTSPENSFC